MPNPTTIEDWVSIADTLYKMLTWGTPALMDREIYLEEVEHVLDRWQVQKAQVAPKLESGTDD